MTTDKSLRARKTAAPSSKGQGDSSTPSGSANTEAGESSLVTSLLTGGLPDQGNKSPATQQSNGPPASTANDGGLPTEPNTTGSGPLPNTALTDSTSQPTSSAPPPPVLSTQSTTQSKSPRKSPTARTGSPTKTPAGRTQPPAAPEKVVGTGYVASLSGAPPNSTAIDLTATHTDATLAPNDDTGEIDLTNLSAVWNRALSLATKGMVEEATMYFRLHASLAASQSKQPASNLFLSEPSAFTVSEAPTTYCKLVTEGGLTFIPGAITSHTDIGFTPYFDRNLKELKGPLPLTIFNKQWQDLANGYHVEKHVKTDNLNKDTTTYTGYPYPHEMTQSYSVWNVNYCNFVTTLRDVYKFKLFASWAEAHQANVEFFHARDNWMTAFRYDIKIRMNAFAFRVSENGANAPPDISQRREDIAAICFAETRRLDEAAFTDNPYAKGGTKFGYDWTTGLPRSNNNNSTNNHTVSVSLASHDNGSSHPSSSQPYHHNGSNKHHGNNNRTDGAGGNGRTRGGYNGKHFNPNFAAKKAAAAAAKQALDTKGPAV